MDQESLKALLAKVGTGEVSVEEAARELEFLPYRQVKGAKVDHHRELRCGFAEAVYGPGKTPQQAASVAAELARHSVGPVLVTRATREQFEAVAALVPGAIFHEVARMVVCRRRAAPLKANVVVASAGTADLPVAEEAAVVLEALGVTVGRLGDVGIAGVHRLLSSTDILHAAEVIVAVAGMEGALPGLIAGLVAAPVIAVPTSTGYGTGAGGAAAVLTMLNSCAPGMAVVNIDNGFGAAVFAATILAGRSRAARNIAEDPAQTA